MYPIKRNGGKWQGSALDIQELEGILILMGNDGWELTTSIENQSNDVNDKIVLIFKREIIPT